MKWGPGKKKGNTVLKHCRKKFCDQCMGKYETMDRVDELFRLQEDVQLTEWQCPACADTCECAACWRKRHSNTSANIPKPQSAASQCQVQQQQQQQQQQQMIMQQQLNMQQQQQQQQTQLQNMNPPNTNNQGGQNGLNQNNNNNNNNGSMNVGGFSMSNMPPQI